MRVWERVGKGESMGEGGRVKSMERVERVRVWRERVRVWERVGKGESMGEGGKG